jgi:hypothetical protein
MELIDRKDYGWASGAKGALKQIAKFIKIV